MAYTRRSGRSRFTLAVLILISITVITLDFRDAAPVRAVRDGAGAVFSPIRGATDGLTSPFRNGWHGVTDYDRMKKENEALRRKIDKLEGDKARYRSALQENRELKKLNDLPFIDVPAVTARVVSGPLTSFESTLEINRGSGDGVKKGMAVVTDAGLAGKVLRVTGDRSMVQLITDPDFQFGVLIRPSGERGLAVGQPATGRLVVDGGLSLDAKIDKGDDVFTSGYESSLFPPDVPVGTVARVSRTADQTEQSAVIDPLADLTALTYVKVLLWEGN